MTTRYMTFLLALIFSLISCTPKSNVPSEPVTPTPQVQPAIISAKLLEYPSAQVTISEDDSKVEAILPYGSKLDKATLDLELAEDCISEPVCPLEVDLKQPFNIFVTAPSGAARKYSFSAKLASSNKIVIKWLSLDGYLIRAEKSGNEYSFILPYGADLTSLNISIASDYALTSRPDITNGIDLSTPKEVKIFAEDGKTFETYTLKANTFPKDTGVRGVYLPSPSHTNSFGNYKNLCESLDLLKELNFNCLYVCAWAATKTAWPSQVLLENSTYKSLDELNMYRYYTGGSGDAVADMISEAHKRDIKVILWFEYGFMHAVGGVNTDDPLLAKHPDWIGLNSSGKYCNYNGTDFYLNSYSGEVQQFMLDLVAEAVKRYPELDGIQGDDRLPASPTNAGYNKETLDEYVAQTGKSRPTGTKNADFEKWKMNNLNEFAISLHKTVKGISKECLVCFAPNKYPWAYNNLCQDWPSWVKSGACEFLTVQCYVTANYERDVNSQIAEMKKHTSKNIFQPAMILKNGANLMSLQMLSDQLYYNRTVGTMGEAQFWFDGLLDKDIQKMFTLWYSYPIEFPDFK